MWIMVAAIAAAGEGAASAGADDEAARFRASGRPVYPALEQVPTAR
jgi:hypothetical protein